MDVDNSKESRPSIQNIENRNKIGEKLKQSVREEIIQEGIDQGMPQEDAEERVRNLENWGQLEKTETAFTVGTNLQTRVDNNN